RVYLFGGGHVSTALGRVASLAGFSINVIDDRSSFANAERFPMAEEIVTSYEEAFEKLKPNASSYLVIVTRGHKDDMRVLEWAVGTEARYIGMIGSKRKVISVYRALEKQGIAIEKFARVHAPVGLEIGALTPEEIAVSVTAELIAIRRNVEPGVKHKAVRFDEIPALKHE
ncbi:MAG: XdhC family protein, partial [Candidatus Acidiferrales bacterium]